MNFFLGIVEGFREIFSHKFRSLLTISGIVFGVGALVAMFATVEGTTEGIRFAMKESGGAGRMSIRPADPPEEQESMAEISPGLTYEDVIALRRSATLARYVSPDKLVPSACLIRFGSNRMWTKDIRGGDPYSLLVNNYQMAMGRYLTDMDVTNRQRVAVLGSETYETLFEGYTGNPLGKKIDIQGISFTVVGVMEEMIFWGRNRRILIPISTMMEVFHAAKVEDGVDQGPDYTLRDIDVVVEDAEQMDAAIEQMRNILLQTHRGIEDFGFRTREDWADAINSAVQGSRISGGIIAFICLLAGGVGITNIMLASIKERTREIGVRRAIGARPSDMFGQIVVEALLLGMVGAVLGIFAGLLILELIQFVTTIEHEPIVRLAHLLISFASGLLVGFFGGLTPAWHASRLSPIEALRYE